MMLALQIEGYSNRLAAQLGDIPIAAPRAGDVRVRVEAAALSPLAPVLVGSSPCKTLREFPRDDTLRRLPTATEWSRRMCPVGQTEKHRSRGDFFRPPLRRMRSRRVPPGLTWHQSPGLGCDQA
jgi:hypothetical protein